MGQKAVAKRKRGSQLAKVTFAVVCHGQLIKSETMPSRQAAWMEAFLNTSMRRLGVDAFAMTCEKPRKRRRSFASLNQQG